MPLPICEEKVSRSAITALSEANISRIQSSIAICSLTDVIICLLKNSLDAAASKIDISVDFSKGACTVEDNGCGIPVSEFNLSGELFKPHCTSKSRSPHLHGAAGNSLSSIAALSTVTVTSRAAPFASLNTIAVEYSCVTTVLAPAPSWHELTVAKTGTRVAVRNLFANTPVRLKERTLADSLPKDSRDWKNLKSEIVALLLAWTRVVELVLRDKRNETSLRIRDNRAESSPHNSHISKAPVGLKEILHILTLSALVPLGSWSLWVPISAVTASVVVRGAISLKPAPTKQCQFISLGITPLSKTREHNQIFQHINQIFTKSRFGVDREALATQENQKHNGESHPRIRGKHLLDKAIFDYDKSMDQWPMFVLRLALSQASSQNMPPAHDFMNDCSLLDDVLEALDILLNEWLEKHHFQPPKSKTKRRKILGLDGKPTSSSKRPPLSRHLEPPDPTNEGFLESAYSWSRLRTSARSMRNILLKDSKPEQIRKSDHNRQNGLSGPYKKRNESILCSQMDEYADSERGTNQQILQKFQACQNTGRLQVMHHNTTSGSASNEAWIQNFMTKWSNPVFERSERTVRQVATDMSVLVRASPYASGRANLDTFSELKLSKSALRGAIVISQLDEKFVLLKMNGKSSLGTHKKADNLRESILLVILDQHAADERCKVESLLHELCKPIQAFQEAAVLNLDRVAKIDTMELSKPILFHIHSKDFISFEQHAAYFSEWGVLYDLGRITNNGNQREEIQVTVKTLPPAIYEQGISHPESIIGLLRTEIWKCEDFKSCIHRNPSVSSNEAFEAGLSHSADNTHYWLTRINNCPARLVDMINSRACRSAVMFNDPLDTEACKSLVSKLAQCALPFQCAHGRPSAIPLVDLSLLGRQRPAYQLGYQDIYEASCNPFGNGKSFAYVYKRWKDATE